MPMSGGSPEKGKEPKLTVKSCIAIILSVVMVFMSFDQVQAKEILPPDQTLDQIIETSEAMESGTFPESSEGTTEPSEEPDTETAAETETDYTESEETSTEEIGAAGEPVFFMTPEGAVILSGFEPLTEAESHILLDEKGTLEEVLLKLPSALKVYADAYIPEMENEEEDTEPELPAETAEETESETEIQTETEGSQETQTETEESQETQTETEGSQETQTETEGNQETEGSQETQTETEGSQGTETSTETKEDSEPETTTEAESTSEPETQTETGETLTGSVSLPKNMGEMQTIPVQEMTEGASEQETSESVPNTEEDLTVPVNPDTEESVSIPNTEESTDVPMAPEGIFIPETSEITTLPGAAETLQPEDAEIFSQEFLIPVTWKCSEDYDNTDLKTYIFKAEWDSALYYYDAELAPTVEVTVTRRKAGGILVSTQEELAAALSEGEPKILLENDISLTTTLFVPASADTALDGQGFSLRRGEDENGTFKGPMIYLGGEGYTQDSYGMLTLSNIYIDGQTADNHAEASAVIDYGCLVMDEGAVVENNCNYGKEQQDADLPASANAYGGGIQVYRQLILSPDALITGNYADELGGGVYLAGGSELHLYADVIQGNHVSENGFGADLYAADGSTVYYDSSVDMKREGFYLCAGAVLICMQAVAADHPVDGNVEVYISIAKDSGYTAEQVAELKSKLSGLGYTILTQKKNDIDTTDLRNWYVYDHYDIAAWNQSGEDWKTTYADALRRPYYPYNEMYWWGKNPGTVTNPVYTIADWLNRADDYTSAGQMQLAQFKEHIYTRNENGSPKMTFVGYGKPAYIDFLFYDPESDGEKVVDFDVDSSKVFTHTLAGSGFLVNTGVEGDLETGKLHGYLVYYVYSGSSVGTTKAARVELYKVDGIGIKQLHDGYCDLQTDTVRRSLFGAPIAEAVISNWQNDMSIQIKATPEKIEVRQKPLTDTTDIGNITPILSADLNERSIYSGFGPLVAYTTDGNTHTCSRASSFTYSNLRMYYTNPELEQNDMLRPLEDADFTQEGTQKYFINLMGASSLQYNDVATFGQYQEFLKMMQMEGIALITDRKTPFEAHLGQAADPDGKPDPNSNLFEISQPNDQSLLSVDDLVNSIKSYISDSGKTTTNIRDQLNQNGGSLTDASPNQSVGNIWLKSVTGNEQIRSLDGGSFGQGGFAVQIMDNISYYCMDKVPITVKYDILKPGSSGYTSFSTVGPYHGPGTGGDGTVSGNSGAIALFTASEAVGMADNIVSLAPAPFVITRNKEEWPEGQYVVRQTITEKVNAGVNNSSIRGYAYFYLTQNDTPAVPDDPSVPPKEPDIPKEETVVTMPAETSVTIENQEVSVEKAVTPVSEPPAEESPEPKTSDAFPAVPVSIGAFTAFMLKIRLWLYEMELGISDEKKQEILQALFSWARGTTKPRVYMAVGASAVVLTIYHILKILDEMRKRLVEKFGK